MTRLAVVLFNLGGPDGPKAVRPFLRNLFRDPAIIGAPALVRYPLASFISRTREKLAQANYAIMGGGSPLLPETEAQARALTAELKVQAPDLETQVFIAMRYWTPFAKETARAVAAFAPDEIVLLPLYPQYSTTTTRSSLEDWQRAAAAAGLSAPTTAICCYPRMPGFVTAVAALTRETMAQGRPDISYRLLLSAHGLPKRVIERGDPYQWQIEQTAAAIVEQLGVSDWTVCYQSRVGPLEWIGPATDAEIRRAGAEGKGVIIAPIAFVSEHSETLVELDIEYAKLARESGVPHYLRVPTASVRQEFIGGLAELVLESLAGAGGARKCPEGLACCGNSRI